MHAGLGWVGSGRVELSGCFGSITASLKSERLERGDEVRPECHELLPRDDLHRDAVAVHFVSAFHRVDDSLIIGRVHAVVQSPALTHVAGNLHVQGLPVVILDMTSMDETFGTKAVVVRPAGLFFFFGADLRRELIVPVDVGLLRIYLWAWERVM
jgi:hypothetical protein